MNEGHGLSRRELLVRGSAALGAPIALSAAGAVSMMSGCGGTEGAARVSVCPTRPTSGKLVCPVTVRDAHLPEAGAADSWSALKAVDADGAEVFVTQDLQCSYLFAPGEEFSIADAEAIRALGKRFADADKKISAFCLATRYDKDPDGEVAFTLKVAAAAVELGVPAIRIDVVPREIKDDNEFMKLAAEVGRRLMKETAGSKVRFGVENHGRFTNNVRSLRKLLVEVDDPRFGVTLDTANFYWFGYPLSMLYELYFEFAPLACHTHAKSIKYPPREREKQRQTGWEYAQYCCPVFEGDIDFARVADIFRERGFRGDLCIENESLGRFPAEQRGAILKREVEHLRRALASV